MTSSIDTNVLVSLWDEGADNLAARKALDSALSRGPVVAAGAVYAELMGGGGRSIAMLDEFFSETGIEVDWRMDRATWERAGLAYQGYVLRRRKRKSAAPKRLLTDFLIGAHAARHGMTLVTLDQRHFRAAFPELEIVNV